ncbi:MAG: class I mannose-6-phosphate isomerase [Anaerolineae bacterium]|nr:class I mannose-6-phosphate isomerase [Anaerolineae bacterium]MDW8173007.1 class I mannose-6-phosphate isomerase [Anaerolineae bacterium]
MTTIPSLPPLKLSARLHTRVWGGRRLADYGKRLLSSEPYGESWEVHDSALIDGGPYDGRTLGDLLAVYGAALVGEGFNPAEGFPLLVKLIDAQDWLSIQVHPDDEQARRLEGDPRGKTEAWIILEATPGARLVIGVHPGTTPQALAAAIRQETLESLLVYAEARPDDVLYMPAGTIHAIGPGLMIYEVQQSSDITYRLYDWGRMGLDGQPRPLHIDKAIQVANLNSLPTLARFDAEEDALVVQGPYFCTRHWVLRDEHRTQYTAGRFQALTCLDGSLMLEGLGQAFSLARGDSALIPANLPEYTLSGAGRLLVSEALRPAQRSTEG